MRISGHTYLEVIGSEDAGWVEEAESKIRAKETSAVQSSSLGDCPNWLANPPRVNPTSILVYRKSLGHGPILLIPTAPGSKEQ
jgi:hypothetical protein